MTNIILNYKELKAIALAASNEESRNYLNGVYVETYEDDKHSLAATNGHILMSVRSSQNPTKGFILATADINKLVSACEFEIKVNKQIKNKIGIRISTTDNVNYMAEIVIPDDIIKQQFNFKPIDGTFPDYRRVTPSLDAIEATTSVSFNPEYITTFSKAAKLLNDRKYQAIKINTTGNALLIDIDYPEFKGVLMQMRF